MHKLCPYIASTMTENELANYFLQMCEEPMRSRCLGNRLALRWELALSYHLNFRKAESVIEAITALTGSDISTKE